MRQFLRPAIEWRVLRNLGATLAVAGTSVGMWGVLAVSNVSAVAASASAPDCTTAPPSLACLKESQENVTASSFGSTCDFEEQGTTTDGFHFIVPASQGSGFSSLTAYFDVNGSLVTVTKTSGFIQPGGKGAIIDEPNGAILLEASATINGGSGSGAGSDGGNPFIVLSSTCAGTGSSSSSSSSSPSSSSSQSSSSSSSPSSSSTSTESSESSSSSSSSSPSSSSSSSSTESSESSSSSSSSRSSTSTQSSTSSQSSTSESSQSSSSSSSSPTTTTTTTGTGGTSAATTSAGSTTQGGGAGAGAGGVGAGQAAAGITSPNTGANLEGPFGIGIGLAVAGLAMLGMSYRRREEVK